MTKKIILPDDTGHLIDLDNPTGTEFIAWSDALFSADFFIKYGQETTFEQLYMQLEFEKDYSGGKYDFWKCLCTAYWPIYQFSAMMKRAWTLQERLAMVESRVAQGDFEKTVWGFTSIGVDVVRRFTNSLPENKSDPFITAMVNDMALLQKLTQKNIPIVTSLRWNTQFSLDTKDGVMDKLDYWKYSWPRYGHCRARRLLEVPDNYLRKYRYKSWDDIKLCMDNGFESKNVFVAFKASMLSEIGKIYFKGMQAKLWNGENPDTNIIRQDCVAIASRLWGKPVQWDKKRGTQDASIYEASILLNRANPKIPVYLGSDRNKTITRGQVIEMIYKYI